MLTWSIDEGYPPRGMQQMSFVLQGLGKYHQILKPKEGSIVELNDRDRLRAMECCGRPVNVQEISP